MAITLAGVTLDSDLILDPPLYSLQKIEAESSYTRGGRLIRWTRTRKDVAFDLIGGDDFGWLTKAMLSSLFTASETITTKTLAFHSTNYTVWFRYEDAPIIEYDPVKILRGSDEATTDLVKNVKIKLVWVVS